MAYCRSNMREVGSKRIFQKFFVYMSMKLKYYLCLTLSPKGRFCRRHVRAGAVIHSYSQWKD